MVSRPRSFRSMLRRNAGVRAIVEDTQAMGVDVDPDDTPELSRKLGYANAKKIARQQNRSAADYAAGNPNTGSERFQDQVAYLESLTGREVAWEWMTSRRGRTWRIATEFVQWFHYHSTREF